MDYNKANEHVKFFLFKWSTMIAKNIFIREFKTVTILKCKQKPLTRGPWATSLTWENNSIQQTHMIIVMLIERRKNPLFTLWEFIFFIWTNLNSLHPRMLWWRRPLNFVNVFSLFRNHLLFKRAGPFIWTNLNPLHWRMHCAQSVWNRPSGSGEEDFLKCSQCTSVT